MWKTNKLVYIIIFVYIILLLFYCSQIVCTIHWEMRAATVWYFSYCLRFECNCLSIFATDIYYNTKFTWHLFTTPFFHLLWLLANRTTFLHDKISNIDCIWFEVHKVIRIKMTKYDFHCIIYFNFLFFVALLFLQIRMISNTMFQSCSLALKESVLVSI